MTLLLWWTEYPSSSHSWERIKRERLFSLRNFSVTSAPKWYPAPLDDFLVPEISLGSLHNKACKILRSWSLSTTELEGNWRIWLILQKIINN